MLQVSYTLEHLYPVLAIVEDPSPPAYEPLSGTADDAAAPRPSADAGPEEAGQAAAVAPKPITSSIRSIYALLRSIGGWRSSFRGLGCYLTFAFAAAILVGIFSSLPFVPSFLADLLAGLALVQLMTVWTHQIISVPDARPFWRRLPSFKRAFEATCMPVFVYWLAQEVSRFVTELVAAALHLPQWDPSRPGVIPQYKADDAWKWLVVTVVALAGTALLIVPAHVVLVRVQASLLPVEDETIVPFDRSFSGTVEPVVVSGKGYVTMRNAWKTFPLAAWRRLILLYIKIFAISVALYGLLIAIIAPEAALIKRYGKKAL